MGTNTNNIYDFEGQDSVREFERLLQDLRDQEIKVYEHPGPCWRGSIRRFTIENDIVFEEFRGMVFEGKNWDTHHKILSARLFTTRWDNVGLELHPQVPFVYELVPEKK